ncbi:MAG: anti-sigma factor [Acidimicrobiia bacterium]|nr:anti-sigma factor [Acidimicrobiia bacterium]
MTCDEFQGRYLAVDLDSDTDAHLAGCTWCHSRIDDLDHLVNQLATDAMWIAPSPGLEDQVVAALQGAAPASQGKRKPIWMFGVAAALIVVIAGSGALIESRQPDWEIALPATDGVSAVATVAGWNTASGTRMVFSIDGLAPAANDEFYEIWMTAPDGRHVSAGTFRAGGTIKSFAGVSRRDFPRIWITLEPNDGDEGIGGPTVLDTGS